MARLKPRHAVHTPLRRRIADAAQAVVAPARKLSLPSRLPSRPVLRIAVPALAVAALGGGVAFSVPQQSVTQAVPATSTPFERATQESVSRSNERPALTTSDAEAATKAAAARAAKEKAAKAKAAKAAKEKAAEAAKAEEAAAKAAAAKKAAEPKKTAEAGNRYAEVTLNLRSAPKDSARTATDVAAGAKVSFTGYTSTSWAQVRTASRTGWVKTTYLTTSKPKAKTAASSGSAGVSGGACASGSSVESGLTSDAIKVHRAICHAFPAVTSYGGVRADSLPEHPSGRALDAMVSSQSQGQAIADWVRAHASELGVSQVIFAQRIWTVQRGSEGWRSMSDRGSATANHYDHVHVTVYGNSAK